MGKQKIGRDIIDKKASGLISTPEESKEFEEWREEREEEKEEKPKEQVELKSPMPIEKEPSADELARERAEILEDMARLKVEGKLKPVHVVEHHRSLPRETEEDDEEDEEKEEEGE
jgi:hypothetical protein